MIIFGGFIWFCCWIACVFIAGQKGRSVPLAVLSGFFFGVFALAYYLAVPSIAPTAGRSWIDELRGKKDPIKKLEELKKLYEQGALSEDEYKKAKEKVIDDL